MQKKRNSRWKLPSVCQSCSPDNQVVPERNSWEDNLFNSIQDWNDIEEQGRENKILNVSYIAYSKYIPVFFHNINFDQRYRKYLLKWN